MAAMSPDPGDAASSASIQTEAQPELEKLMHKQWLGRWRMNEVNASVH
jgi:hypothetical protein